MMGWNEIKGIPMEFLNSEDVVPMQFMGTVDANGREEYEGDVVEYVVTNGMGFPIKTTGKYEYIFKSKQFAIRSSIDHEPQNVADYKVVGNIYDNPGLFGPGK